MLPGRVQASGARSRWASDGAGGKSVSRARPRGSRGEWAAEIEAAGGKSLAIQADVADAKAMMRAADEVELKLGPIDVWVNNAMVTIYASVTDIKPEEFQQVTQVTYLGQVYGTQAALKHMRARNRGTIICIGSALAYRSIPFRSTGRQSCGSRLCRLAAKRAAL